MAFFIEMGAKIKIMNKQKEFIISAGIDIGTSTTKIIISKLSMINVAGASHVPKIEIVDKEILYKSPIYRTPLIDDSTIDANKIESIIYEQYESANISPDKIETGAVIITGQAATKSNASEMVHHLSKEAGEFLVATAGPDLEGIIAAKGSGVFEKSKGNDLIWANIDIGGGTANIAVYQNQMLLGTCTLHIGGRLIEFQDENIINIAPPIIRFIEQHNLTLRKGDSKDHPEIDVIIDYMIDLLYRTLHVNINPNDSVLLLGKSPSWTTKPHIITFSGGVSECIYHHEQHNINKNYDDIGKRLAEKIKASELFTDFTIEEPLETVRATVIGAGMQTTEISGATIQIDNNYLPLRNVPIIKHDFKQDLQFGLSRLSTTFTQAQLLFDSNREGINFALSLSGIPYIGFYEVQEIAKEIIKLMNQRAFIDLPIILIIDTDIAKVLGQSLIALGAEQPIICIDQIKVETGDYIDIGKALNYGVVPIIIKTLSFHSTSH